MRWTVVIPTKALPAAKSRLLPASADAAAHRHLVEAIRADTVAAASAAPGVARVLVITDRLAAGASDPEAPIGVIVQTAPGLNPALSEAAEYAARSWPSDGVAVLVGDLPALRSSELSEALAVAATHARAHVSDAAGTGTTLLTAAPGVPLRPSFGAGSAARHALDSATVSAGESLRHDVDTAADLHAAAELGLGLKTVALLAESKVTVRST